MILKKGEFMKESMRKGSVLALSGLVLGLCVSIACQDKAAMTELEKFKAQTAVEAQNIETVRTLFAELSKGNAGIIEDLFASDSKYYSPSNSPIPLTRDQEIAQVKTTLTAFPDMTYEIKDIFAANDRVVVTLISSATHKGEFMGILATGKKASIGVTLVYRFRDGKVVEEIEDADFLGLFMQLGMELKPKEPAK